MQVTNNYYDIRTAGPSSPEDWDQLVDECLREQREVVAMADMQPDVEKNDVLVACIEKLVIEVRELNGKLDVLLEQAHVDSEE